MSGETPALKPPYKEGATGDFTHLRLLLASCKKSSSSGRFRSISSASHLYENLGNRVSTMLTTRLTASTSPVEVSLRPRCCTYEDDKVYPRVQICTFSSCSTVVVCVPFQVTDTVGVPFQATTVQWCACSSYSTVGVPFQATVKWSKFSSYSAVVFVPFRVTVQRHVYLFESSYGGVPFQVAVQ